MQIQTEQFDQVIERLKSELAKLRTGRAHPAFVEDVMVDYYGQKMPIKQLARVFVPEAKQIVVQPWDKNALQPIETAIQKSDLGFTPNNEGDKIRIVLPDLTAERREEISRVAKRIAEEARVKVRNIREEIWKEIQEKEEKGEITEDDRFRLKDELQEAVDERNDKIKELAEKKEDEIKTI